AAAPAAAPAAHVALWAEPGGDGEPIPVRMAVHGGARAAQTEGPTSGPDFNRAARLLSVAHGGQVLVSAVTVDVAGDRLPPDVRLRDLGEHRLGDLARLERVFELLAAEPPTSFPPLRLAPSLEGHYEGVTR